MNSFLKQKLPEVIRIFREHKVDRAYAFGSVCTDDFTDQSDVDFVISFPEKLDPLEKGELYFDLLFRLEDYLGREIDLLTEGSLRNPYFIKKLNSTKTALYE